MAPSPGSDADSAVVVGPELGVGVVLVNLFVLDASGKRCVLQVQLGFESLEGVSLAAITYYGQRCFRHLLLNGRKRPQHTINTVMPFEVAIRKKHWAQFFSVTKRKPVELDDVEDN